MRQIWQQELSCRKQIARQLRTQYVEGIYRPKYYTVMLTSTLRVTQVHWKWNHWIDHTRLTIGQVIWRWILSWPWNVGWRSLKVIENGIILKLGYSFLYAFDSNYGRIFNHFGHIQHQIMVWPWNLHLGLFKVVGNGAVRQTMCDFLLVCHCDYSSILYHLCVVWRWIISWPWNLGERSLKVIETGAIQNFGCSFLFTFYSNYGCICSSLWDI